MGRDRYGVDMKIWALIVLRGRGHTNFGLLVTELYR